MWTLKLALQKRLESKIPPRHAVMTWLVQHAGDVVSKYVIGHDGKTAYERIMGNPCREEVLEFGESVYYKLGEDQVSDLDARWASGTWLGKRWKSTEHLVHTAGGMIKCRAVKRRPLENRWDREEVEAIVATPWRPNPSSDEGKAEARVLPPLPEVKLIKDPPRPKEPEVRAPLRPRITKSDLLSWGYTDGCLRCRQMRSGQAENGSTYSELCRTTTKR